MNWVFRSSQTTQLLSLRLALSTAPAIGLVEGAEVGGVVVGGRGVSEDTCFACWQQLLPSYGYPKLAHEA